MTKRESDRLALHTFMWTYVALSAFACNLGALLQHGWLQVGLLVMALWCAESVGRIRERLAWTKPLTAENFKAINRKPVPRQTVADVTRLSGKLAAKEGR